MEGCTQREGFCSWTLVRACACVCVERGLWGLTHWLAMSLLTRLICSRVVLAVTWWVWRGSLLPPRGEEPGRATPGLALLGGGQGRRRPRRAIDPLEVPPHGASGMDRASGQPGTGPRGRGGAGADRAWGSSWHRLQVQTWPQGRKAGPRDTEFSVNLRARAAPTWEPEGGKGRRAPPWRSLGVLFRAAGTPSAAPALADLGGPLPWLYAPANTVAVADGGGAPTPGNTAAAPPLARSRPPRPARGQAAGPGRGRT